MREPTARERIAEAIYNASPRFHRYDFKRMLKTKYDDGSPMEECINDTFRQADAAIAIIHAALTDPDVIAQGDKGCAKPTHVQRVVENVWSAAFGADDDGVYPAGTHFVDIVKGEMKRRGISSADDGGGER